jgi:hypothetical protein
MALVAFHLNGKFTLHLHAYEKNLSISSISLSAKSNEYPQFTVFLHIVILSCLCDLKGGFTEK